MLDRLKFLEDIEKLKTDYDINIAKRDNSTDRKRITILITDAFLIAKGGDDQAFFFEQNLFAALKFTPFTCDPIEAEERYWEMSRKQREGWNPLKLVSSGAPQEPPTKCMSELNNEVMKILKKEAKKDGIRGNNQRRGFVRTFKNKKVDTFRPQNKKRISLHIPG